MIRSGHFCWQAPMVFGEAASEKKQGKEEKVRRKEGSWRGTGVRIGQSGSGDVAQRRFV